jgi:hypothetical protein
MELGEAFALEREVLKAQSFEIIWVPIGRVKKKKKKKYCYREMHFK